MQSQIEVACLYLSTVFCPAEAAGIAWLGSLRLSLTVHWSCEASSSSSYSQPALARSPMWQQFPPKSLKQLLQDTSPGEHSSPADVYMLTSRAHHMHLTDRHFKLYLRAGMLAPCNGTSNPLLSHSCTHGSLALSACLRMPAQCDTPTNEPPR